MAHKQKKKRNKKYQGNDSSSTRPTITRVQAVNRNRVTQWWHDHRRVAKPILITSGVILAIGILLFELLRIIFGW